MFGFCKYVPRNLFYSVQLPLFPNRHFSWQIFWLIIAGKAPVLLITNHGSVSCIGVPVCRLSLCVMSNVFREKGPISPYTVYTEYTVYCTSWLLLAGPQHLWSLYFSPPTSDSWIRRCRLSLWLKVTHICQLPMYHLRSKLRQPVMNEPASFARYDAGWLAVQNKSTWHELSGVQSSPPFAKVVFQFSCFFLNQSKNPTNESNISVWACIKPSFMDSTGSAACFHFRGFVILLIHLHRMNDEWKNICPLPDFLFLDISHSWMFQIMKQNMKDSPGKYKIKVLNHVCHCQSFTSLWRSSTRSFMLDCFNLATLKCFWAFCLFQSFSMKFESGL